jgi:AmmeMemoRadiSam system protein B
MATQEALVGTIRPAAVAGTFYPDDPQELDQQVSDYLEHASESAGVPPKAIIAPHAGYIYSGPVAAAAYARIAPLRHIVRRVVLLGPCHRVAIDGLALPTADAFATPLGIVPVDREACAQIAALPQVHVFDPTHRDEHGLEVHLPFLQRVLEDFAIVPLVVGEASDGEIAEVLEQLWGGPETLIVISSDLSHYHDYHTAQALDTATSNAIEALDPDGIGPHDACGRHPVRGLLRVAARRGMAVATLDLRNSGDTAGSRDSVVGYGAWVFSESPEIP